MGELDNTANTVMPQQAMTDEGAMFHASGSAQFAEEIDGPGKKHQPHQVNNNLYPHHHYPHCHHCHYHHHYHHINN